jgi:hypothetical protein
MGRRAVRVEEADHKGLIRESYRMEGIGEPECRSIFVDWALSLPADRPLADALRTMIAAHALEAPEHPMSRVLAEALAPAEPPRRRGGRAARLAGKGT